MLLLVRVDGIVYPFQTVLQHRIRRAVEYVLHCSGYISSLNLRVVDEEARLQTFQDVELCMVENLRKCRRTPCANMERCSGSTTNCLHWKYVKRSIRAKPLASSLRHCYTWLGMFTAATSNSVLEFILPKWLLKPAAHWSILKHLFWFGTEQFEQCKWSLI